jgi:hypothetical protein
MATKYFKRPMKHHFNEDGSPRFKYTVDPVTGKHTVDPEHAKYLDYEIVSEEVPDPPVDKFLATTKKVLWTILKGILFIAAYGAYRGHQEEKRKQREPKYKYRYKY